MTRKVNINFRQMARLLFMSAAVSTLGLVPAEAVDCTAFLEQCTVEPAEGPGPGFELVYNCTSQILCAAVMPCLAQACGAGSNYDCNDAAIPGVSPTFGGGWCQAPS